MNQINPWLTYLTDQMRDKYGFPKHIARRMVSHWLKSFQHGRGILRSADSSQSGFGERVKRSPIVKPSQMRSLNRNGRELNSVESRSEPQVIAMPSPADRKPRYRVERPILCLAFRDNHHAAVTIQAGQVLEVIGPSEDDRFAVVEVNGNQFLVFDSDLKDFGKLFPDAASAPPRQLRRGVASTEKNSRRWHESKTYAAKNTAG